MNSGVIVESSIAAEVSEGGASPKKGIIGDQGASEMSLGDSHEDGSLPHNSLPEYDDDDENESHDEIQESVRGGPD